MQHRDRAPWRLRPLPLCALLIAGAALTAQGVMRPPQTQVQTTLNDFHQPGTQPLGLVQPIDSSQSCTTCHSSFDTNWAPYERWAPSMMAQAGRDPIFYAALAIANQDAAHSGELCLRCHAPGAWLDGRSTPSDGSALDNSLGDLDGVTCHLCHRLVDPVLDTNFNPRIDQRIHEALAQDPNAGIPPTPGNGQYIVDPTDIRRGPFDLGASFGFHDWRESPFHRESLLCGTCHEVSNPTLSRQPDGTYALNALDQQHPTHDKHDEFPLERTFSEWAESQFAHGRIEMDGRFGGNLTAYSTCQDCHMQIVTGMGCNPLLAPPMRPDMPQHNFAGVNSWVLRSVRSLYPDAETGLTNQLMFDADARMRENQRDAVDVLGWVNQGELRVRLVNQTGHKLPTGYGEGRRMWIHVAFLGPGDVVIVERGAYDPATAVLTTGDTRVYRMDQGLDAAQAALTGVPAGTSFHFVLNNTIVHDNRIPPRGFTNARFDAVDAEPVGHVYAEEQYWDDVGYAIPPGAVRARIEVFHQTTTKEYIEFLRDTNVTNGAGLLAYNEWVAHGKSEPVLKGSTLVDLVAPPCVPPIQYGRAKQLSNGRYPGLAWSGSPSVGGVGFALVVRNGLPGSFGQIKASATSASTPYQGGTLLLGPPTTTVASFQLDATGQALVPIPLGSVLPGTQLNYQAIFRDRGVPGGTALTNAVHVEYCP